MTQSVVRSLFLFLLLPFSVMGQTSSETTNPNYLKARNCIIEEIKFEKVELTEAVAFFTKETAARDPEKQGLNFIVKEPADPESKIPTVTLNLKKIPLSEVLKYVSALTGYQLKYEEHAIVLLPPQSIKKP